MTTSGHRAPQPGSLPVGLRFALPELPSFAVQRPRLVALLDVAAQQPLTVVAAPPGYGKSVLLAQWARAQHQPPVRWLTLGPEHDDPLVLLDDLKEALAGRGAPLAGSPLRPGKVHPDVRSRFLADLLAELERIPATTLVLDDFHQLSNALVLDLLAELFDHAPRSLRVIAATRVDPPLRFFRLHEHGVLFQLRQEDLGFNPSETGELVRRLVGVELSECQLTALVERTEGWAAGLQLAALALGAQPRADGFVETFTGDDRAVADYLTERVLRDLPPDLVAFLSSTCPLDRMSGPLCDFVTGRDDSQRMLDELERRSLFITTLDSGRSWFRYHRLFLTYLRSQLHDRGSAEAVLTLQKAAEWHLRRGDLDTAVAYLLQAGCWEDVLRVAATSGPAMLQRGHGSSVAAWIGSVPRSARWDRVGIALDEAAALLAGGELAKAGAALGEIEVRTDATPSQQAVTHLLRAWWALRTGALARAAEAAERAAACLSLAPDAVPSILGLVKDPHEVCAAATIVKGASLLHQGRFTQARDALDVSLDGLHAQWQLLALSSRALLEAWSERLDPAEQLANQALRFADELEMGSDPATIHALLASAAVARNRGHFDDARRALVAATSTFLPDGDRLTAASLVDEHALLALAEGDAARSLSMLAGQPALAPPGGRGPATGRRPTVEADVFLSIGDVDRAARSLGTATGDVPGAVAARIRLELARGDLSAAKELAMRCPDATAEPPLGRMLAMAVVEHLDGDETAAARHLDQVVRQAELEGNVGMFRWHEARSYVRSRYRAAPTPFLRSVVEQPAVAPRPTAVKELVEQLTEREFFVLQLLPTRLTNAEIARSLGVSLNTVKTHLKHVYRKLGVAHRTEAIAAAERLGLL